MLWGHRRKEINHRHYLIIISPSAYFCLPKKICAVIPRSECCDPVLKENLRWELISYSELLWNLELTPPVIYCQTLNHQSQKPLISSSNVFDRLPWLQNVPKKNLDFQLEICQPCRLSRSNDFWSAERNWFHYFQIIRQQLLELNFTENGRKSLSRKISHFKSFAVFVVVVNLIQEQQF